MLNYVWAFLIVFSFVCACVTGATADLSQAVLAAGSDAVSLCLKLTGVMCLWCGLMNIAQQSGLCRRISGLFSPLLKLLFPTLKNNTDTLESVSMNITANLFGLGNAATPLGISAIKKMQTVSNKKDTVSRDMAVFTVMNTAALRLIPTTAAALREAAGATEPMDIIFCVWISSAFSLVVAVLAVRLTWRFVEK